jgi:ABC-type phosphate transport system substrate-binding protein
MESGGIGYVDLTATGWNLSSVEKMQADAAKAGVKVLGIKLAGPQGQVVYPTPENIRTAMYPLSQRLYLYVHPKASETAKDFAKFIATCGASAATPYADVEGDVRKAFLKNGLIPLPEKVEKEEKVELKKAG